MKSVWLVLAFATLILTAISQHPVSAQTTCIYRTIVTPDGAGGCCSLIVEICYKTSNPSEFIIESIEVPNDCNIIPSPGVVGWLQRKTIYLLALEGILGFTIPTCPATVVYTTTAFSGSCMGLVPQIPGAPPRKLYNICSETTPCLRTCAICLSPTEMDPCSPNQATPMVIFAGCSYSGVPCNLSSGCPYNTCVMSE